MAVFTLHRITFNDTSPTYGVLLRDTAPLCVTLELPWKENAESISCIPPGTYPCAMMPATEDLPYPHFAIQDVPGRSNIRIHAGNTVADVKGCCAVGESFANSAILQSRDALNYLVSALPPSFYLIIINP